LGRWWQVGSGDGRTLTAAAAADAEGICTWSQTPIDWAVCEIINNTTHRRQQQI
jgi:hypothetical protein